MAFPLRHIESAESLYSENSDDNMMAPVKHTSRPRPRSLHFKAPTESQRYQSEEEIPSPGLEEEDDYSEFSSRSEAEGSQDEVTIDPTIDLDNLEVLHSTPYETAKMITILCSGRAAEIRIGRLSGRRRGGISGRTESPIQKMPVPRRSSRRRQRSISLYNPTMDVLGVAFSTPTQSSFDSSSRSSSTTRSRSPSTSRSVTNFSAPHRNPARPRPGRSATNPSLSSIDSMTGLSPPSLCRTPESPAESELPLEEEEEDEEGEALMRESLEVQVRTRSAERTRQMALSGADNGHYSDEEEDYNATPKLPPTSYDAYDPYALAPPQLASEDARRGKAVSNAARKWRGFARMGRRGRVENAF